MSNNTGVVCTVGPGVPFYANCGIGGIAGSSAADRLKTCCPVRVLSFRNKDNNVGSNCEVMCNMMTAEEAERANPCLEQYFLDHSEAEISDDTRDLWTCPSPEPSAAVRGGTRSWGSLVVLCLGVSAVATML
ncbi:hypothetical protein V493_05754 [Pseudogymnoascus sp. VKM F-4281 (FW-2241)]|nr:hypothetical protein V493_05754 [Pseudogymnoascus sp. VKM F-4281 (FW-2241)]